MADAFRPREHRLMVKGKVARDGYKYRVTFERPKSEQIINQHYDFTLHPLRRLLARFIMNEVEGDLGGSLNGKCRCLKGLGDFLVEKGESDLTPEVFAAYSVWLFDLKKDNGERKLSESTIAARLNIAISLYAFGLTVGHLDWNQRSLDIMRAALRKMTRGRYKRHLQDSIDRALSLEAYSDLAKAVTLEFEQCKQVLNDRNLGIRQSLYNPGKNSMKVIDPNPYVVFALQCAMRLGLRATELNTLTRHDINIDPLHGNHEIYVHAPDKNDDFIPIDETFLLSLRVCKEWDREARALAGESGEEFLKDALLVYRPTSSCYGFPFFQLSTYYLNISHLKYFFKKWFNYKINDQDGNERPLLHADGDTAKPLYIDYRSIRNSFAIRFAERERNRATIKRVMRHKNIVTTQKYYLQLERLDAARKMQIAMKSEAQLLVMGLSNAVTAGISEATLQKARDAGAITPHGVCEVALEGQDCDRANDCLECPHLVVIASRRPRFSADRDAYLDMYADLHEKGDIRGAENALSRAKLCQAQLLRIDETFNLTANENKETKSTKRQ
jgi:integrase